MSGGSFDYLCDTMDLDDLLKKRYALEEMADELAKLDEQEYPGAEAAAVQTKELLIRVKMWEVHVRANVNILSSVWQAVEWNRSGDWGQDAIKDALKTLTE